MKTSEWLTVIGILVTLWAIHATASKVQGKPSRGLSKSREWAGSGVDPFGASYTVEKTATAGGL
jgi:hypothetical protein